MVECKYCIHIAVCAYASHSLPICDSFADDIAPVVHAHWVCVSHEPYEGGYGYDDLFICSNCNSVDEDGNDNWESWTSNYCPNCGAKMDGE